MKGFAFPIQDEHENGGGGIGMQRVDERADAECREFEPRTEPTVFGIERGDRFCRSRTRGGVRPGAAGFGEPRVRWNEEERTWEGAGVLGESDGAQRGAIDALDTKISGSWNGGREAAPAAPISHQVQRTRRSIAGWCRPRTRVSERTSDQAYPTPGVRAIQQAGVRATKRRSR
jgi:hypothetical protein